MSEANSPTPSIEEEEQVEEKREDGRDAREWRGFTDAKNFATQLASKRQCSAVCVAF